MAKLINIIFYKNLEQLFNRYEEQIQELCHLYDIHPKSKKDQTGRMNAAAKELRKLLMEDQSFNVSSIFTTLESGTEMIKKIIQALKNDSDPIQPCSASGTARDLSDTEKKSISIDIRQHDHKMMQFMKYLKRNQKAFPKIQELIQEQMFYKLRTAYNKMGINIRGCETCTTLKDDSEWEVKIPSEVTGYANIKYSVSSSEGQHECSETGLRWRSGSDVSLEYQFVDWTSLSKDIMKNYKPCGPLMDITVTSGTLEEIQLPHFVCADSVSSSDDAVKALHVKDGTVSVERCELSGFHAKLVNPTVSLLAIVVEAQQYLNMKFYCETLIYRKSTAPLNLHVYLILKDKKLKKEVEKKEKNNMEIVKPVPDEALKINDYYTLQTSCDSKIKPQKLKLTPCKANFFDLNIKDEMECFELCIMTKEGQKIWDVNIQSGCETCATLKDDSEWEVEIPSEVTGYANIKYSVSSSEGKHECSETGLRWRSGSDVSLEYQFVDWTSLSKDIMKNYKPCGPLMDITVTSGTLEEIQLPHFVCADSVSSSDDAVKALHVKDGTVSVERCELSGFHAKLVNPTFSFLGVIANVYQYLTMKFHCETLIYRKSTAPLNLHVYLILKDRKLKKDVERKEKNNMEILKPTPDEALKIFGRYTLQTSCDSKIKPQKLKLTPCKANFFDLHIKDEMECFEICIMTKEGQKIWDVDIESEEFNINSAVSNTAQTQERCKNGAEFVEKHRTELIRRVSLVEPLADDMIRLIGDEKYRIILKSGISQAQMRTLLDFLTTPKLKEKLYQSLVEHEHALVKYLEHSE